jgi:GTP pyrophosphokinase
LTAEEVSLSSASLQQRERTLREEAELTLQLHSHVGQLTEKEEAAFWNQLEELLEKIPVEVDETLDHLPKKAFALALKAHSGQKRVSGSPYITHPLAVAKIVADLVPDRVTLAACLLHDVLEDTGITPEILHAEFGDEVAFLVEGVTNVSRLRFGMHHEKQVENLRRLLVATAKDLRVILIKLCDRLHNMRTLGALPTPKQKRIAQSTLDIFSPLAHRLGLERIKNELEDLCLLYLHPTVYRDIKIKVDERLATRQKYARKVQNIVADVLATNGIDALVEWRVKHFWSIFLKMQRDNKDFSEIYDLTGVRVIVDTLEHCYASLGIIHGVWPPVEGRFKDYISKPKSNDYRSLHTTVMGPEGRLLEIQIRTHQMNRVCEEGVAAHWRYKERGRSSRRLGDDAAWLNQMSGLLQDTRDQDEWTYSIKTDLFSDESYCYTPKGDIIRLPVDSCPIDFAYHIHTDLGDHCQGARVNGRYVPLSYQLKTGDVVQIETSKSAHPSPDWLNLAKSSRARHKIRNHILQTNRETLIEQGRVMLSRELHRLGMNPVTFFTSEHCREIMDSLEIKTTDDLFALVGFGRVATKQVVMRILKSRAKEKKEPPKTPATEKIKVTDMDDLLYRRARCCQPVPGENIIGLVTRGRGISIHREDCVNIRKFQGDRARLIPIGWEDNGEKGLAIEISVEAYDRNQLLADVTSIISSYGIDIRGSHTESTDENHQAVLNFTIRIRNINQLQRLANQLIEVKGIKSVHQKRGARTIRLA